MTFIVGIAAVYSAILIASTQNDLTKHQLQLSQAVYKAENYPHVSLILNSSDKKLYFTNVGQQAFVFIDFKFSQPGTTTICGGTMSNNVFTLSRVVSIPMLTRDSYPIPLPIQTNCDGSQDYNVIAHVQDYIGNNYTITFKLTVTSQGGYLSYTAYLQNIEPNKAPTF